MISVPNYWRVEYLVSMGKFDEYEKNTRTVDNLDQLLYTIAKDKIVRITPLYVTEFEHPVLTKSDVDKCYDDMERVLEIKRLTKKISNANAILVEATEKLSKLQ